MPNKWVEFVKKWSAENNMNYMCAMTTKECKEAYLKAHPKEPKKAKKAKAEVAPAPPAPPAPDRSKVQKELVDMGMKAMEVADKRANIQMELSEMGKKAKLKEAQKEAQDYLASKVPKKVVIRKKKAPKADAPNTDVARFQEAETNPALKVLTNSDLLKMIGSFTKGMKRQYTDVKGVRGKLRDDLLAFFKPIFQTPEYKMVWYGEEKEPTDDVNDGEVDFKGVGIFKWKDILYIIEEITLKKDKYDQKNFGYKNDMDTLVAKLFVKSADAKDDFLKVEKRSPTGLWKDSVSVKIPIPPKIKDSKFRYYGFRADPNA